MKYFVVLLMVFLSILAGNAQVDSLLMERATVLSDSALYEQSNAIYKQLIDSTAKVKSWEKTVLYQNKMAENLIRINKYEAAEALLIKSEQIALTKLPTQKLILGDTYLVLGRLMYKQKDIVKMDAYTQKAFAIFDSKISAQDMRLVKTYNLLGLYAILTGNTMQAKQYFDMALQGNVLKEEKELADTYNNYTVFYQTTGDLSKAIDYQKKVLLLEQKRYPDYHYRIVKTYYNLGLLYNNMGYYQQSLEYLQKTLASLQLSPVIDYTILAMTYNYLGIANSRLGNVERGTKLVKKALKTLQQKAPPNWFFEMNIYNALGVVLDMEGDLKEAFKYEQKSLELAQQYFPPNHFLMAMIHNNIALDHIKFKEYEKALEAIQKTIHIQTQTLPKKHPLRTEAQNNLTEIYIGLKEYKKTFKSINNAIKSSTANDVQLLLTYKYRMYVYLKCYEDTQETGFLKEAYQACQKSDALIKEIRTVYKDAEDQIAFGKHVHQAYEYALQICQILYKQTQNRIYLQTAFSYIENSKAYALLQSIEATKALQYANIPDSLLTKEKKLKRDIAFNEVQKFDVDSSVLASLENTLLEDKQQYRNLISKLEKDYPQYYQLKYQQKTTTLQEVQQTLKEETALISYFVGDSTLFVIALDKDSTHFYQSPKDTLWEQTFQDFRKSITSIDYISHPDSTQQAYDLYTQKAHYIYQTILEKPLSDLAEKTKHLIIIPDEKLNYVPFELLLSQLPKTSEQDYKNLAYLLHKYSFSYGYAAALLSEKQEHSNSTYGGFAPIYKNDLLTKLDSLEQEKKANDIYTLSLRDGLDDLPFARQSISNIAKSLGGTTFLGEEATKNNFLKKSKDFGILHLAMHGIVDDKNPLDSKLVFTPSAKDSTNHLLRAAELYNIELNAELAVLSACNTGLGKISKGEGVMSISRAFTYAGCPSLVMSLWSVPDASTAQIITSFFKNIKLGQTKDKALQQAKISYLKDAPTRLTHPIYWAGFVPVGNMQAIDFPNRSFFYLWRILVFLSVGLLGYFGWRKFY